SGSASSKRRPSSASYAPSTSMPPSDSRYAIVAENPASSSYGAVPGSNLRPTGTDAAGRALYGRHDSSRSCRAYAMPRCGPQNLYAEQMKTSQPSACTLTGTCAAYCTASTQVSAPTAWASSDTRGKSTIVPTAFDE